MIPSVEYDYEYVGMWGFKPELLFIFYLKKLRHEALGIAINTLAQLLSERVISPLGFLFKWKRAIW